MDFEEVTVHSLAFELEARVQQVATYTPTWPEEAIGAALVRFDEAVAACFEECRQAGRCWPDYKRDSDAFELTLSREPGPATSWSIDEHGHPEHELACMRAAARATRFPGSGACDQVRIRRALPWPHI